MTFVLEQFETNPYASSIYKKEKTIVLDTVVNLRRRDRYNQAIAHVRLTPSGDYVLATVTHGSVDMYHRGKFRPYNEGEGAQLRSGDIIHLSRRHGYEVQHRQ